MKLHHAPTKNVADLLKVYWTWFWHLLGWTWAQTLVWYCSMTQVSDQWWALLVAWQWLTFEYRPRCHVQTGFRTRANLDLTKQDAVRKCAEIERFYCRSGSIQKKEKLMAHEDYWLPFQRIYRTGLSSPIPAGNLKRHGTLQGLQEALQDVRVSCKFRWRFLSFTSFWRLLGGAFFSSSDLSCFPVTFVSFLDWMHPRWGYLGKRQCRQIIHVTWRCKPCDGRSSSPGENQLCHLDWLSVLSKL